MNTGYGSYERCGVTPVSVRRTRLRFLYTVHTLAPDVMNDLHDRVFLNHARQEDLEAWASSHNLEADWCVTWARSALTVWERDKEARDARAWTSDFDVVRVVLFPDSSPCDLTSNIEKLRATELALYSLGIIDFCPDEEFDVRDLNGLSRNRTSLNPNTNELQKLKEFLPPERPRPHAPPDWYDAEMRPFWRSTKGLPICYVTSETLVEYIGRVSRSLKFDGTLLALNHSQRANIAKEILEQAQAYYNYVCKFYAKQAGWQKLQIKPALIKHLQWAVTYQVLKQSRNKVARTEGINFSSVSRGVASVFNAIGLQPRKETGGKPIGGTDKGHHVAEK